MFWADACVRLVEGVDFEFDIITEDLVFGAFERQTVQNCERVRGNRGSQPLNHITVVVIVRRLDQYQAETSFVIGHVGARTVAYRPLPTSFHPAGRTAAASSSLMMPPVTR